MRSGATPGSTGENKPSRMIKKQGRRRRGGPGVVVDALPILTPGSDRDHPVTQSLLDLGDTCCILQAERSEAVCRHKVPKVSSQTDSCETISRGHRPHMQGSLKPKVGAPCCNPTNSLNEAGGCALSHAALQRGILGLTHLAMPLMG